MRLTDLEKRTLIQVIDVYLSFDFNKKFSKRTLRVENIKRKLSAELSKSLDNKTMKNTRTLVLSSREKEHRPLGTLLVDVVESVIEDRYYGSSHKDSK